MARLMKVAALLLLAAGAPPSTGPALADCVPYENYVHWVADAHSSGGSIDVTISGSTAFIAHYTSGLQILDVSNPESPGIIGAVDTPGSAWAVALSGDFAYVADDRGGLQVVDVGDPWNPAIVASVAMPGYVRGVCVAGSHAYVAEAFPHRLEVIDIADPIHPKLAGGVDMPDGAGDVAVSGGYAYVSVGWSGLQVVDITDPQAPGIVGQAATDHAAAAVVVAGARAYVAGAGGDPNGSGSLHVIDITDPRNPRQLGEVVTLSNSEDVAVSGTLAFVPGYHSGLQIIDVTNPQSPELLGRVGVGSSEYGYGVDIAGDYAYFIEFEYGLQVIRIANGRNPGFTGGIDLQDDVQDLVVSGTHAYAAGAAGLQVIDVSDPSAPAVVGRASTPSPTYGLDVSGTHAYAASTMGGLMVFDVADPANPQIVGTANVFYCFGVTVSYPYAYVVAGYPGRLDVVDISDPSNPQLTGSIATPGDWPRGSAVSGHYAYVAAPSVGLVVVDVANPYSPTIVGELPINGYVNSVSVRGPYAYVTDAWFGLYIVDITDPPNPRIVSVTHTPGPGDATPSGNKLYLSTGGGLLVMDISAPAEPRTCSARRRPSAPAGVLRSRISPRIRPGSTSRTGPTAIRTGTPIRILPGDCSAGSAVGEEPRPRFPSGALTVTASPNPFISTTRLLLDARKNLSVDLEVLDLAGRSVLGRRLGTLEAGPHSILFDGRDGAGHPLPAGIWFVQAPDVGRGGARAPAGPVAVAVRFGLFTAVPAERLRLAAEAGAGHRDSWVTIGRGDVPAAIDRGPCLQDPDCHPPSVRPPGTDWHGGKSGDGSTRQTGTRPTPSHLCSWRKSASLLWWAWQERGQYSAKSPSAMIRAATEPGKPSPGSRRTRWPLPC